MTDKITKSPIPRIVKILLSGIRSHGLPALTMQVSPEPVKFTFALNHQRSRFSAPQFRMLDDNSQNAIALAIHLREKTGSSTQLIRFG